MEISESLIELSIFDLVITMNVGFDIFTILFVHQFFAVNCLQDSA